MVGRENPPALCTQAKAVGSLAPGPKASEGGDRKTQGPEKTLGMSTGAGDPLPGSRAHLLLGGFWEPEKQGTTPKPTTFSSSRTPAEPGEAKRAPRARAPPTAVPASAPDNGRPRREA